MQNDPNGIYSTFWGSLLGVMLAPIMLICLFIVGIVSVIGEEVTKRRMYG